MSTVLGFFSNLEDKISLMLLHRYIVLTGEFIIGLLALLGFYIVSLEYDRTLLSIVLFGVFVSLLLAFLSKESYRSLKGAAFRPSVLFLIGFCIVHFQGYLDVLLGYWSPDDRFMVSRHVILKCACLSLVGLCAFFIGYYARRGKVFVSRRPPRVYPISYLVLFCAILFFAFVAGTDWRYFTGAIYGQVDESAGVLFTYLARLLECSLYAIPILHCRNLQALNRPVSLVSFIRGLGLYNIILGLYLVLVLASGDRGAIIYLGICYVATYLVASQKKISVVQLGGVILVGSMFIAFLGLSKSYRLDNSVWERLQLAVSAESRERLTSVSPYTQELAGSIRTLHKVVAVVPAEYPYTAGRFQLQQLFAVVPTGSRWLMSAGISPDEYRFLASTAYATWLIKGDNPTSGTGTTCILDFYIDLGLPLVAAGMFLFGFWSRRFDVNMYSTTLPLWLSVFIFTYTAKSIYIPRSTVLFELKMTLWTLALIFIYQKCIYTYSIIRGADGA